MNNLREKIVEIISQKIGGHNGVFTQELYKEISDQIIDLFKAELLKSLPKEKTSTSSEEMLRGWLG